MTQSVTHTPNQQYDLISVLYHALEGVQTCDVYVKDAEQGGDSELAQFFRQVQQEDTTIGADLGNRSTSHLAIFGL